MAISFRIFPAEGYVHVSYKEIVRASETVVSLRAYRMHPDFSPDLKQLIDTSEVTEFIPDFVEILELQARLAEIFTLSEQDILVAFLAPGIPGRKMADIVVRSWSQQPGLALRVFDEIEQARDFLGLAQPVRQER